MENMKLNRLLVAVAIGVMFTTFLNGCASAQSGKLEVIQDSGKFYKVYLEGDVNQARQNLEQMIEFFKGQRAKVLGPSGQAHYLFCSYARLYVLEKRVGNKDNAEAALIKARYWQLESYELSDDDWKSRVPMDEFMPNTTPEKISEIVDKLDKGSNNGKEPKYVQYLMHAQSNN
jgi:hypothetical protein